MNKKQNSDSNGGFVSSYLLYLLAAASEAASNQFHGVVRQAGLRVPEWRVLACLIDQDGEMITRLARFALIEQSRLTRIIDQMDQRGLVIRKNDDADGRRVRVFLTEKGRRLASKLVTEARHHESQLLQSLQDNDGVEIKNALRSLLNSIEKTHGADT